MTKELTQQRLQELLHYDPDTGIFTRLVRTAQVAPVGSVAGGKNGRGYIQIKIDGSMYLAHRLAWLYVHGGFPSKQIDHINCVKTDNRIANLRNVSQAENNQNLKTPKANNTSGYMGVSWDKCGQRWKAYIAVKRKQVTLGYFENAEDAYQAYLQAKHEMHPFFSGMKNEHT